MRPYLFTLATALLLSACNTTKSTTDTANTKALDQLQQAMTGTFTSAAQAAEDDAFYDITLHMYPIWKDRGHWLYVEQAVSAMPAKPYRQRIYQLEQVDKKTFKSIVYTVDNEDDLVGDWQVPESFNALSKDNLRLREGCAVILTRQADGSYTGSTEGDRCKSTLRGAAYATSEVTVMPGKIVSWDRGFDASGAQVWGAEKGGYIFLKE
ncbi:chromophore lyase CpcT/CpeT [Phaeodactylibacter sp.]|uniref:chromophore lyase CpcT/CpeT n=1 Tax=Phaeodactylibacter sp. TaxID=1940289 RepID=UPI0025E55048|nr:chromophore lyase CpcT/CpeT [Phaeodactylibacter sp.]MCI4650114.1 chromophore lyase CpcT/CpeT [Phaeodactylibacter sp.]MCI5091321.1 chromophore lyase CpcT/CpeT [Phaeodactylibacter sp.]